MRGNIPIPELKVGEEVWLVAVVTSVREKATQHGERSLVAQARNASGGVAMRVSLEASGTGPLKPGIWGVLGRLELFQNQAQFAISEYRSITAEKYRELQGAEPALPRAYTIDVETIPLVEFRERAALRLRRALQAGRMNPEQQQRYLEDPAGEEERAYRMGSLSATSGRVLSIAVHVGPVAEIQRSPRLESEHVFGIDAAGQEQSEQQALSEFLALMSGFDPTADEIVGHNIIGFDLPFIFQRCLTHDIAGQPLVSLAEYNPRGVYDTMMKWWLGAKNRVSLDDLAWALGLESSKTDAVDGSLVFDLYQSGKLSEIREYNLNDVRLTRRVYERMVGVWGR